MKFRYVVLTMLTCVISFAAEQTWSGTVSDSMCGANHQKMAAQHGNAQMSARDCTAECVKSGAKYVFVSNGKVYNIENQDLALLQEHAGHNVQLTGEMKGDTITVAKIAMPASR